MSKAGDIVAGNAEPTVELAAAIDAVRARTEEIRRGIDQDHRAQWHRAEGEDALEHGTYHQAMGDGSFEVRDTPTYAYAIVDVYGGRVRVRQEAHDAPVVLTLIDEYEDEVES